MKVIELLFELLNTQTSVLNDLRAMFGDFLLIRQLRCQMNSGHAPLFSSLPLLLHESKTQKKEDADFLSYTRLENHIESLPLPHNLKSFLWTYPYYRLWIESPLHLEDDLSISSTASFLSPAIPEALHWLQTLSIAHPTVLAPILHEVESRWKAFHIHILADTSKK